MLTSYYKMRVDAVQHNGRDFLSKACRGMIDCTLAGARAFSSPMKPVAASVSNFSDVGVVMKAQYRMTLAGERVLGRRTATTY